MAPDPPVSHVSPTFPAESVETVVARMQRRWTGDRWSQRSGASFNSPKNAGSLQFPAGIVPGKGTACALTGNWQLEM